MNISDRRSSVSFSVVFSTLSPICARTQRVCRMGSEENDRHEAVPKYCYPIASLRLYLICYFMLLCLWHWNAFGAYSPPSISVTSISVKIP